MSEDHSHPQALIDAGDELEAVLRKYQGKVIIAAQLAVPEHDPIDPTKFTLGHMQSMGNHETAGPELLTKVAGIEAMRRLSAAGLAVRVEPAPPLATRGGGCNSN